MASRSHHWPTSNDFLDSRLFRPSNRLSPAIPLLLLSSSFSIAFHNSMTIVNHFWSGTIIQSKPFSCHFVFKGNAVWAIIGGVPIFTASRGLINIKHLIVSNFLYVCESTSLTEKSLRLASNVSSSGRLQCNEVVFRKPFWLKLLTQLSSIAISNQWIILGFDPHVLAVGSFKNKTFITLFNSRVCILPSCSIFGPKLFRETLFLPCIKILLRFISLQIHKGLFFCI